MLQKEEEEKIPAMESELKRLMAGLDAKVKPDKVAPGKKSSKLIILFGADQFLTHL